MYKFESAQGMAQQHPDTFDVASIDHLREVVKPGVYAKVCVTSEMYGGERIWTDVVEVKGLNVKATFANDPAGIDAEHGDPIEYQLQHIYNVQNKKGEDLA